jgi:hypothetical protein
MLLWDGRDNAQFLQPREQVRRERYVRLVHKMSI